MFKALDKIRYDQLHLNQEKTNDAKPKVKTLLELSCLTVNQHVPLVRDAMVAMPTHLAPTLLQIAISSIESHAISTIIANWPLETLSFSEILPEDKQGVFEEDMGCDFCVFRGIISRSKTCRLKCLDFCGLKLNSTFTKLIIQMWPLLSLRKYQLKPKKLAKVIGQAAGVDTGRLTEDILPKILSERMNHEIIISPETRINLKKGQHMEVKMDSVHFSTNNMFFMDYLICNGLRSITPIHINVTNIHIKSELSIGDEVTDSLAPFIVLKVQDTESLEGLSLRQLEEGIFFIITSDIKKCSNLKSLDIQDCNIYLQEGITRSRTRGRTCLVDAFQSLRYLQRLDISFNYLVGCLGEILNALQTPLEYLSLRGCDLNERDLDSLAKSKHAGHLRELNMSKLCQFSIYETDRISPAYLLKVMRNFHSVTVLNLSQNHLPDAAIVEFSQTLSQKLTRLKGLDIAGNILTFENQMLVTKACAKIPTMQWLRLTCVNNMLDDAILPLQWNNAADMCAKFKEVLSSVGRNDICVDVVRLSFAILVDLIDIFD